MMGGAPGPERTRCPPRMTCSSAPSMSILMTSMRRSIRAPKSSRLTLGTFTGAMRPSLGATIDETP